MTRQPLRVRLLYCALSLLIVAGCDSGPSATPTVAPSGNATSTVAAPSDAQASTSKPGTTQAVEPTAGGSLSGELTFLVFGEPAEAKAFVDVGKAFEAKYPNVKIKTTAVPSQPNHLMKLATDFAAGDPPDVWVIDYRRFGLLQNAGVVEPVESYLEQSTVIHASDFYTRPLQPFTYNGQLQCIPMNMSSLEVYYSKDLFDRAKLPYPHDGWTWDEFVEDAKAITALSTPDEKIYGVGIDPQLIRLAPFIWQNGGDIVDDLDHPTRLTLDTPEAREAFQWFVDLELKHHVVSTQEENVSLKDQTRFLFNTLGMWLLSRRVVPALRTATGFEWDVAPLPQGKQKAGILHSDAYCISKATKNKELAWKFVEYANGPEGQVVAAKTGRTVPSLVSVANSPVYLESDKPPKSSDVFLKMGPYLRATPQIGTWPDIELKTNAIIEQAFYGYITVDEAIKQMEADTAIDFQQEAFPSTLVVPTPVPGRHGEDD
ncbi:MAG: multiple sugar transport system substrate-binding protein [Chloroflexia bacterium]|nr:multiple sugar transport system substrate-binding protein [Chloroflexia bacterium]